MRRRYRADRSAAWEALVIGERMRGELTMVLVHELFLTRTLTLALTLTLTLTPTPTPNPNPTQVLVHELGAVLSFESPSTPLAIGETVRVAPTAAGELSVV